MVGAKDFQILVSGFGSLFQRGRFASNRFFSHNSLFVRGGPKFKLQPGLWAKRGLNNSLVLVAADEAIGVRGDVHNGIPDKGGNGDAALCQNIKDNFLRNKIVRDGQNNQSAF